MAAHRIPTATPTRARPARPLLPVLVAVFTLAASLVLAGCSDGENPSTVTSKAASAAESLENRATAAASSLAAQATGAIASATAEIGHKLDGIKGGKDAKKDVKLGPASTDPDGRAKAEVTATNPDDAKRSFAVQVNFTNTDGTTLDTVLVTIPDVPAGGTGTATARSSHGLSGEAKAQLGRAVRY
ncbi:hypothetical protein [Streptomyces sp. NPDC002553]|uniref:hypothetical protein n=1 Tax=unclassified Streptomyces TaxID=2593676 RepID=UPI00331F9718